MALARHRRRGARGIGLLRATGSIERADPIPPGVYWIDLADELAPNGVRKIENFVFWLQANRPPAAPTERVRQLRIVHHDPVMLTGDPARDWILFRTFEPINRWGSDTGLGLPSTAPLGIQTSEEDTIQSPEPPGFWDSILPDTTSGCVIVVGVVLAGGLVVYGITRR